MIDTATSRAGRVLLALPFILGGRDSLRNPGARAQQVAASGVPQPEMAVRANGLMMVLGGIGLVSGRLSQLAAAMLVLVLVPTTLVGHAFWRETDPQKRGGQLAHFLKNLSMIGGLLVVLSARHAQGEPASSAAMERPAVR